MTNRKPATGTLFFVVLALLFGDVAHTQAYIDPGSASYVFQLLIGGALGALFVVRSYWTRLKMSVGRLFRSSRAAE